MTDRRSLLPWLAIAGMIGLYLGLLVLIGCGQEAPPRCTVTVYAAQRGLRLAHAHTFAEFRRGQECVVISWGPARGNFADALTRPVAGKNYTLAQTLAFARAAGCPVTAWGPYRCRAELFERARAQQQRLQSGAVRYVGLDLTHRDPAAVNCIGAVAGVVGPFPTGLAYGRRASRAVVRHLRPYLLEAPEGAR